MHRDASFSGVQGRIASFLLKPFGCPLFRIPSEQISPLDTTNGTLIDANVAIGRPAGVLHIASTNRGSRRSQLRSPILRTNNPGFALTRLQIQWFENQSKCFLDYIYEFLLCTPRYKML
jgi:hypothetical protein